MTVKVVLPILPAVLFLLVSAFCFARSSRRLNDWFVGTKLYKNNLDSYVKGQGMTKKTKKAKPGFALWSWSQS